MADRMELRVHYLIQKEIDAARWKAAEKEREADRRTEQLDVAKEQLETAYENTVEAVEGWIETLKGASSFVADATDSVADQFRAVLNGRSKSIFDDRMVCDFACGLKL